MTLPVSLAAWLLAFGVTLACELPVCWLMLRREPVDSARVLLVAALATGVTHPLLWFVVPGWFDDYTTYLVAGETGVVLIEALLLWLVLPIRRPAWALLVSATANALSLGVGLLL